MSVEIRPMIMDDYAAALALWQGSEGMGLSSADQPEAVCRYLARNPGMSLVACDQGDLVGAVLCGHDGRRGYLHHLAVKTSHRHRGLGKELARRCLQALKEEGIDKCHLFVIAKNQAGRDFWSATGWVERVELVLMSANT